MFEPKDKDDVLKTLIESNGLNASFLRNIFFNRGYEILIKLVSLINALPIPVNIHRFIDKLEEGLGLGPFNRNEYDLLLEILKICRFSITTTTQRIEFKDGRAYERVWFISLKEEYGSTNQKEEIFSI